MLQIIYTMARTTDGTFELAKVRNELLVARTTDGTFELAKVHNELLAAREEIRMLHAHLERVSIGLGKTIEQALREITGKMEAFRTENQMLKKQCARYFEKLLKLTPDIE